MHIDLMLTECFEYYCIFV